MVNELTDEKLASLTPDELGALVAGTAPPIPLQAEPAEEPIPYPESEGRKQRREADIAEALEQYHRKDGVPRYRGGTLEDDTEDSLSIINRLECGDFDFRLGLLTNIQQLDVDIIPRNFAVDFLVSAAPQDVFEGALIAQMAATHQAAMSALKRLSNSSQVATVTANETAANKLLRTYAAQMEALRKHRNKGTQTVKHVHVNEGGQAIVANTVTHGGKTGDE